tara:strand:+ start:597 stop:875 length:279 start_codon:yes stop_codon:yes gene_type:complete
MRNPTENVKETLNGIENIRGFLKEASKKMPERKLTGFIDHIEYMKDVLNDVEITLQYFDDSALNKEIDLNKMKERLKYLEEMDELCRNRACS